MKNKTTRADKAFCPKTFLLVIVIILAACHEHTLHHSYQPVNASGWDNADTLHFNTGKFDEQPRTHQYRIGIRHKDSYPYRDIWLTVGSDTLHLYLADTEGRWLGQGFGEMRQLSLPVSLNAPSDTTGRTSITHIMQHNPLPGISDIGLYIELTE